MTDKQKDKPNEFLGIPEPTDRSRYSFSHLDIIKILKECDKEREKGREGSQVKLPNKENYLFAHLPRHKCHPYTDTAMFADASKLGLNFTRRLSDMEVERLWDTEGKIERWCFTVSKFMGVSEFKSSKLYGEDGEFNKEFYKKAVSYMLRDLANHADDCVFGLTNKEVNSAGIYCQEGAREIKYVKTNCPNSDIVKQVRLALSRYHQDTNYYPDFIVMPRKVFRAYAKEVKITNIKEIYHPLFLEGVPALVSDRVKNDEIIIMNRNYISFVIKNGIEHQIGITGSADEFMSDDAAEFAYEHGAEVNMMARIAARFTVAIHDPKAIVRHGVVI